MKEMLDAAKEDHKESLGELREDHDEIKRTFVPLEHFKATVSPIQESMREIQKDIKQILKVVSRLPNYPQ